MTISFTAILAAYLCAGALYTQGIIADMGDSQAEDRSLLSDGMYRLDPAAIAALLLFILVWPAVFIWARIK